MVIYPKAKTVSRHTTFQKSFMLLLGVKRSLSFVGLLSFSTAATLLMPHPLVVQAQTPPPPSEQSPENDDLRPLSQDGSLLSVQGGQRLMQEAGEAASAQNYDLAVQKLQQARQVFNQLSNFYQDLGASFAGIDLRIADDQRQQAISTAQLRDEATYQLALVHRAQNKPELSVPLLIQIVRSQNPTRELGKKAYEQLYELGFVSSPYPRNSDASAPAP